MAIAVVAIVVVLVVVGAWGLLAWQLRQGAQPVPTSWGKQFRRRDKD
ncbi:MAG: hypothetical protein ACJ744_09905 [Gaiellaceae bacterium]|jgi:hypothetical protein